MHSYWSRFNAVLSFASTVLAIMLVANFLSVFFLPIDPQVSKFEIREDSITIGRHRYLSSDMIKCNFDLDVDFSSLFNWNTKHVFVYIVAEYDSPKSTDNQVIVWDRIIRTKDESVFSLTNQSFKYHLLDFAQELRGNTVTFKVEYSVGPMTGHIYDSVLTHFGLLKPDQPLPSVTVTFSK